MCWLKSNSLNNKDRISFEKHRACNLQSSGPVSYRIPSNIIAGAIISSLAEKVGDYSRERLFQIFLTRGRTLKVYMK